MAVDPWSVLIYSAAPAAGSTSPNLTPPSGYIWVITDVSAWQGYSATASLTVEEAVSGITIVQLEPPSSAVWYSHWSGRQVIPAGMAIKVVCNNTAGNIRISGYQLLQNIPT